MKNGFILRSKLSTAVAKFPVFSAMTIREGYTIFRIPNPKTIMIEVQYASRSKHCVVPYSKDISETILLDSVIFCNVHIFLIE